MSNAKNFEKSTTVSLLILFTAAVISVHAGSHRRHGHGLGCRHCGPGFAVLRPCGHGLDTECASCRPGQYQPHHSYRRHCLPCSRCGRGLFEAHSCTAVRDAVCDSCHTLVAGPHSEDFYVKCGNETIYALSPASESGEDYEDEDDLWQDDAGVPGDVMLVRDELTHMRHDADRPVPLEQQVRPHGVHSKLHTSKHAHLNQGGVGASGGGSAATVVTAVVSICVVAGLLFAVVLSRWRTNATAKPYTLPRATNKEGYIVVSQSSSENSSPV